MLPSCFFCPIAALDFSPQSVTTVRLLPPSSFVRLALEQNQLRSFLLALLFFGQNQLQSFLLALLFFGQNQLQSFLLALLFFGQNQLQYLKELVFFAVRTGLEPATPGVTGRYSNQLNYRTICSDLIALFQKGVQRYNFL